MRFRWGIFSVAMAACLLVFILLVRGVQHGDTYVGRNHTSFASAAKFIVKKALVSVKNGIYHEATVHNPAGDTIPDEWDDSVKSFIKRLL